MASRTTNLLLADLATGESGVLGFANWGEAADDNWARVEDALTETSSISLTGSNVTLTDEQERSVYLKLTGTLSANVEVRTNDRKGFWFVHNGTTGAFSVTFKTTSGSGVVIPQGSKAVLVCDGTDIFFLSSDAAVRTDASQTLTAVAQAQARSNVSAALKGQLYGLTLSNNSTDATNDIDIAAGEAASTETNPVLMVLASSLTKRLDAAWAVGTGNGGLDTGSIANTTYHVWLIRRSDTGVVDALFSTSVSSPTMPANYDQKRRIGSIIRGNDAIIPFTQFGDLFQIVEPEREYTLADPGAAAALVQFTRCPDGLNVEMILDVTLIDNTPATTTTLLLTSPGQTDLAPSSEWSLRTPAQGATVPASSSGRFHIMTNTSRQIRYRIGAASNTDQSVNITVHGWFDRRGRTT